MHICDPPAGKFSDNRVSLTASVRSDIGLAAYDAAVPVPQGPERVYITFEWNCMRASRKMGRSWLYEH